LNDPTRIVARVRSGVAWSACVDVTFHIPRPLDVLRVTEIMYNPADSGPVDGDEYEFVELKNTGTELLDLSGVALTGGILYAFPEGTFVRGGAFAVVVANAGAFQQRYPDVTVSGAYRRNLSNGGDTVELRDSAGAVLLSITYRDSATAPWLAEADGAGHSLVPVDPSAPGDPNDPASWRVSLEMGGSPGADDRTPEPTEPEIVEHPQDLTVREGDPASFTVMARGYPLPAYRWLRNGLPVPGATRASYQISAAGSGDDGAIFSCVVENAVGTEVSNEATLTVLPAPRYFLRGDANGDRAADISDAVAVLRILFGHADSQCADANDANDDGAVNIADAVALLSYLFAGGSVPPEPFPACGEDLTPDGLDCEQSDLSCRP
jgi:hypothetical protein